jgi:hypothetical protein
MHKKYVKKRIKFTGEWYIEYPNILKYIKKNTNMHKKYVKKRIKFTGEWYIYIYINIRSDTQT